MDISATGTFRMRNMLLCATLLALGLLFICSWSTPIRDSMIGDSDIISSAFPTPKYVPIAPNNPPIAVVNPSFAQVLVNERLGLSAEESSDPDGSVVEYRWSFGSKGDVYGPELTLMFTEPGLRTITLTVEDNDGDIDSTTVAVNVLPLRPEPIIILSAGPDNILDLATGEEGIVVLELIAYNHPVSDLQLEVLDDGGLDVSIEDLPASLRPGEPVEISVRISAKDAVGDLTGSIVILRVVSAQAESNVERVEVMVKPPPTTATLNTEIIEFSGIIIGFLVLYIVISKWKNRGERRKT